MFIAVLFLIAKKWKCICPSMGEWNKLLRHEAWMNLQRIKLSKKKKKPISKGCMLYDS